MLPSHPAPAEIQHAACEVCEIPAVTIVTDLEHIPTPADGDAHVAYYRVHSTHTFCLTHSRPSQRL